MVLEVILRLVLVNIAILYWFVMMDMVLMMFMVGVMLVLVLNGVLDVVRIKLVLSDFNGHDHFALVV